MRFAFKGIVVTFIVLCSCFVYANLPGAITFEAPVPEAVEEEPQEKEEKAEEDPTALSQTHMLNSRLKRAGIFENPRLVKKVYGNLQGVQKAVDEEYQKIMAEKEFKTEEERAAFEEHLKKNTLLGFSDFEEEPAVVTAKIAEQPLQKAQEIVSRMKRPDISDVKDERNEDFHKRASVLFEKENGLTVEEFDRLQFEQAIADAEKAIPSGSLDASVRFKKKPDVTVEKVNETTGLIKSGTGNKKAK